MGTIKRLFVEKKKDCNIEALNMFNDLRDNLKIAGLNEVRILNRYDIENISQSDYDDAKYTIFSEPTVDNIYEENIEINDKDRIFAVEYLPGQYDQRADSAMQCVQLISQGEMPLINVAKIMVLSGNISDDEFIKIKNYCINPVDSREADLEKSATLVMDMDYPQDIKTIDGFINKSKEEIIKLATDMEIAMSIEDLIFCQDHFKNVEKRDPYLTEIKVIDTYWSDHCRHTTFLTKITDVNIEDGYYKDSIARAYENYLDVRKEVYQGQDKDITLMDIAILAMKALSKQGVLDNLDKSDEINACSIVVDADVDGKDEQWLIMFKNETHNHPTEIEPFGGAATCLGGAIRDPLSGRAYVYQAMRVTGAADPTKNIDQTLEGKLPQRKITTEAAKGYSSYGNQIGVATGLVSEIYHEDYVAKRMEIGAVVGAVKRENVVREVPKAGDIIILVGGRTGRDGCGGATGSSKEHTLESINKCGAEVQKGNAPTERKLQRLFRNPFVSKMIKRCNDFGAGGVSVAIGELADGLEIYLDAIPKKYEGLDGTELAISESQERMAVVVNREDVNEFMKYAKEENLEATPVAKVTDSNRLVMVWRESKIVDISRDFLDTNGASQSTKVNVKIPVKKDYFNTAIVDEEIINGNLKSAWLSVVKDLNISSQKGLVERFDASVGAGTVLMPFGGVNQMTPIEAMVAKVPALNGETTTVTVMSYGYNAEISKWSPFHGASYAVIESLSKIVATGGDYKKARLTFQEYFEKLGADYTKWGKPFAALIGAFQAQMSMGVAAIGGKDSMSGTFMNLNVPPTLVSFAIAPESIENIISPEFKESNSTVVYLPLKRDKFDLPDYEYAKELFELVNKLIKNKICISAHTVGKGGIIEAVSKMSFGNSIGLNFYDIDEKELFKPAYGSFVLELTSCKVIDFGGLNVILLGETIVEPRFYLNSAKLDISEILEGYEKTLESVFPTHIESSFKGKCEIPVFKSKNFVRAMEKFAKPRVLIPTFPGTNCEYDSKKAFDRAGADSNILVVGNGSASDLSNSIEKMVKEIKKSQIIMIPGGFSAGDEPDGSGKFIAAVFRNPYVKEAVTDLLKNRDGLMLGICNGFQALIKIGLLPYGEIMDINETSPTLTFNEIGRHVSCLVNTKIVSNLSPWLSFNNIGDIHKIPVSHGEGRFIATPDMLKSLINNGQIATQYVDSKGNATYDIRFNPNGSFMSVEGITSPDGRVFGKMGHSERIGAGLYKNVIGNKDQKIFEAGVDYFK